MIIIGEKINGAIPKTAEAIKNRDAGYIAGLAKAQADCGSDYLDVCAGTSPDQEYDALCWLIDVVQEAVDVPVCIDSPDPHMIVSVFPKVKKPGIINSISGESDKCEVLLPVLQSNPGWQVVALCSSSSGGVPALAEDKVRIAFELIEKAAEYGVGPERMHLDPLVLAASAVNDSSVQFCEAIRRIKAQYPDVKIAAALSNVSFGMPARSLLNRNFLTLAMAAGLDTAICDPTNREIIGGIYATEVLLGRDRFCRKYNNAFRAGKIGTAKG